MKDFSKALLDKIQTIEEKWVEAVLEDGHIQTAKELTYKAIRDSVPLVLQAIATILSQSENNDIKTIVSKGLEHGTLRAKQGYDAEEIAREYRLLRWAIFYVLEPDLVQGTPTEVLRACRLIDTALDETIARCFKTYTEERLRELEDLQNQMRLTNQELTRLLRDSKDNLSHLAHELKTPLTSIIGYSDLFLRQQDMKAESKDSASNLDHIEKVLQSGRRLLHLINDALEISRYEAGKMPLKPAQTDLRALINSIIEMMEPLAQAKNIALRIECERAPERVLTDSLRLQQILTNLLSNAIRYTESGCVKLECEALSDEEWCIAIADTGIGITSEDQAHIYDPYFRAVASDGSYVPNSTGLGLAIVKRLVKLLQGKIELTSKIGVGSTFIITFPREVVISGNRARIEPKQP